jgi:hypothetical protein
VKPRRFPLPSLQPELQLPVHVGDIAATMSLLKQWSSLHNNMIYKLIYANMAHSRHEKGQIKYHKRQLYRSCKLALCVVPINVFEPWFCNAESSARSPSTFVCNVVDKVFSCAFSSVLVARALFN